MLTSSELGPLNQYKGLVAGQDSHQGRLINKGGQRDVTLGQPPTVMRAQSDLDLRGKNGNVSMTLM